MACKAESTFQMYKFLFMYMPLVLLAIFSIVFYVRSNMLINDDIAETEAAILMSGIFINPGAFSYVKDGRVYPYVDREFFTGGDEKLARLYDYGDRRYVSMRIALLNEDASPYENTPPAYLNKETYEQLVEIARSDYLKRAMGPGQAYESKKRFAVNIKDGEKTTAGLLDVSILVAKS